MDTAYAPFELQNQGLQALRTAAQERWAEALGSYQNLVRKVAKAGAALNALENSPKATAQAVEDARTELVRLTAERTEALRELMLSRAQEEVTRALPEARSGDQAAIAYTHRAMAIATIYTAGL